MDHAFQIPTTHKNSIFKKRRLYRSYNPYFESFEATEIYQAYKLPIITHNPFIKVNSN